MGLISRLYNFANGATADAEQVDAELDQVLTLVNGNIENANVKSSAAIAGSKIANDGTFVPGDGWNSAEETWTYASSTTFTISGDKTGKYQVGDKLKLTNSTVKYFYITIVSHAAGTTTVTVNGGTDYTLANAAISANYYSKANNPQSFPQWFNYTSTWTGFSSAPAGGSRFTVVGRTVIYVTRQGGGGTSNATTATISLPITASASLGTEDGLGIALDNGTWQTDPGLFSITASGTTATLWKAAIAVAWTASGTKGWMGVITYEI
jgi:hypothetical protein